MPDGAVVLDSSALLAHHYDETGADSVSAALSGRVVMSTANWAEVLDVAARRDDEPSRYLALLELLPLTVEHARASHRFRLPGLSLGDRCCLGVAAALGLPVMTADGAWRRAADRVEVIFAR